MIVVQSITEQCNAPICFGQHPAKMENTLAANSGERDTLSFKLAEHVMRYF
jgi:hypothetical protein